MLTTLVHPSVTALHRDTPAYGSLAASVLIDLVNGPHRGLRPGAGLDASRCGRAPPRRPRRLTTAPTPGGNGSVTCP